MSKQQHWINNRIKHIEGLKKPSAQQQEFIALATNNNRSKLEERDFKGLLRVEKLADEMLKAKAVVSSNKNANRKHERKARDHELYLSAGLLIMADLVDTKTGMPTLSKGKLLGALMSLAKVDEADPRWEEWERVGNERLNQASSTTSIAEPA